jgi:hypothetical protein
MTLRQQEPSSGEPERLKLTPWLNRLELEHRIPGNNEAALHLVAYIRRYGLQRFNREYEQLTNLEQSLAIEEGSRLFNQRFIPILTQITVWLHIQTVKWSDRNRK